MTDFKQLKDLMRADVDPQDAARMGVWYEPRSLWLVKNITLADYSVRGEGALPPVLRVQLPRNPFRNGSKWPITINRFAVSGVGYPLARPASEELMSAAALNCTSVINTMKFEIAAPYRKSYTQGPTMSSAVGFAPRPTANPSVDDGPSSLYGTTTLKFDKDLIVPKAGTVEWDISSLQGMRWNDGGASFDLPSADVPATMSYLERGGLFQGNARSRRMNIRTNQSSAVPTPSDDGIPYAMPPSFVPLAGATVPFWDPTTRFNTQEFRAQNATRAGSTCVYGMTSAIDQIDFDDAVLATWADAVIAPMSTRIGTRVRLVGGPVNDWWWRPGAPMALTFDTVTPAAVYWLDTPITLMPGDALDVSVEVRTNAFEVESAAAAYAASYQFGISFNGFAAIDG